MKKKDQEAIAKLYLENSDMSEFETQAPYREQPAKNNAASMSIEDIVKSNISVALDQLHSPEYNGHALTSHIDNIFDTLDENNIQYDPYEVEPLVIQFIRSSNS